VAFDEGRSLGSPCLIAAPISAYGAGARDGKRGRRIAAPAPCPVLAVETGLLLAVNRLV
jgi:hypothetical protein